MKMYIVALAVGVLVGAIYGLLQVRSPAPPIVALVGLLGILIGEQAVPIVREMIAGRSVTAYLHIKSNHHVFGRLPDCHDPVKTAKVDAKPPTGTAAG